MEGVFAVLIRGWSAGIEVPEKTPGGYERNMSHNIKFVKRKRLNYASGTNVSSLIQDFLSSKVKRRPLRAMAHITLSP